MLENMLTHILAFKLCKVRYTTVVQCFLYLSCTLSNIFMSCSALSSTEVLNSRSAALSFITCSTLGVLTNVENITHVRRVELL